MSQNKIGIISQARMTSTRLPGKVLKKVNNKTILEYHIDRIKKCDANLIIATTINKTDDPIVELCKKLNITYYRGDENNVLSRYYYAAKENNLDIIIRVTSDCPLIDPSLINKGISAFLNATSKNTYLSNCLERTFPRGFDFEIFTFHALELAFLNATSKQDLEHVTPYLHQNRSGNMEFQNISHSEDKSNYRITLDTENDFLLIKELIRNHDADKKNYSDIISILDDNPTLVLINKDEIQKTK